MSSDNRPIGIFDSGIGGLTVLKSLAKAFPHESFLYVGDVARLPYGNKSPDTIRKYGEQILRFLKSENVKLAIIACNTASTVFLEDQSFEGIPLFNVIAPGAEAAVKTTKNKKVGVIGTATTVKGKAYSNTLKKINSNLEVTEVSCPLFVPLAEEGLSLDPVTTMMSERYLSGLKDKGIDTLILGCTHYPLLRGDISQTMGESVSLVESGEVLSQVISLYLNKNECLADSSRKTELRVCTTDVTEHFLSLARKWMHPQEIKDLERIVL